MPTFSKSIDIELNDYDVEIEIDVDDFMDEADLDEVISECISRDSDNVLNAIIDDDQDAVINKLLEDDDAVQTIKERLNLTATVEDEPLGERVRQVLEKAGRVKYDDAVADVLRCMMLQTSISAVMSAAVKVAFETYEPDPVLGFSVTNSKLPAPVA